MSDLKEKFVAAAAASKNLSERPANDVMLKMYALYKQADTGDCQGKRPGFTDMIGRAKFDAWEGLKGLDSNAAMQQYIDLIDSLKD